MIQQLRSTLKSRFCLKIDKCRQNYNLASYNYLFHLSSVKHSLQMNDSKFYNRVDSIKLYALYLFTYLLELGWLIRVNNTKYMSNNKFIIIIFILLHAFLRLHANTYTALLNFSYSRTRIRSFTRARVRFIARYAKRCMKNAFINVFAATAAQQQSKTVATDAMDAATAVSHLTHSNNGTTTKIEKYQYASWLSPKMLHYTTKIFMSARQRMMAKGAAKNCNSIN